MNDHVAEIGSNSPDHRDRALAIGERFGAVRHHLTSPGCTSPCTAGWITVIVEPRTA